MRDDVDLLTQLNVKIGVAESNGDREFLSGVMGPALALRRANGPIVDRTKFLDDVEPGSPRETVIESVDLLGQDRAVVTCIVSMEKDGETKHFHNVRLFVRSEEGRWVLIGWANEPLTMPAGSRPLPE